MQAVNRGPPGGPARHAGQRRHAAAPDPGSPVEPRRRPRIIGIDDWAWRRGQRYGTIIVDLERNRPIDLLPDRQADTVAAWLKDHPGVEIVARIAPAAMPTVSEPALRMLIQVSDRWHLLRNLNDALARAFDRHHRDLHAATTAAIETSMAHERAGIGTLGA